MPAVNDADRIYQTIAKELDQGRQAYVVYPVIEDSEKVDLKSATEGFKNLSEIFKGRRVGILDHYIVGVEFRLGLRLRWTLHLGRRRCR